MSSQPPIYTCFKFSLILRFLFQLIQVIFSLIIIGFAFYILLNFSNAQNTNINSTCNGGTIQSIIILLLSFDLFSCLLSIFILIVTCIPIYKLFCNSSNDAVNGGHSGGLDNYLNDPTLTQGLIYFESSEEEEEEDEIVVAEMVDMNNNNRTKPSLERKDNGLNPSTATAPNSGISAANNNTRKLSSSKLERRGSMDPYSVFSRRVNFTYNLLTSLQFCSFCISFAFLITLTIFINTEDCTKAITSNNNGNIFTINFSSYMIWSRFYSYVQWSVLLSSCFIICCISTFISVLKRRIDYMQEENANNSAKLQPMYFYRNH
ncbi:hypothetical protein ABK040_014318 [Willaertia magna]